MLTKGPPPQEVTTQYCDFLHLVILSFNATMFYNHLEQRSAKSDFGTKYKYHSRMEGVRESCKFIGSRENHSRGWVLTCTQT